MYYGEFIARCDYVHGTWASFTIVEGNNELLEAGRIAGSRIDVPREASSFEEMQP